MGLQNKGRKHTAEVNKKKGTPNNKFSLGRKDSVETRLKKSEARKGKPGNAIGNNQPRCSCILCKHELTSSAIKRHFKFYHTKCE